MKKWHYFGFLLWCVQVQAQDAIIKTVEPIEKNNIQQIQESRTSLSNTSDEKSLAILQTTQGDSIEAKINHAILYRDWHSLEKLLPVYQNVKDYDKTLYGYAKGALYRSKYQHKKAVKAYQEIINDNPDLAYVRFDLGVMAFENKQYKTARKEILAAKDALEAPMQRLAESYLAQIDKIERTSVNIKANYEQTDNVNNAPTSQVIQWQGKTWVRDEDSRPKSAKGVSYGVSASKTIAVADNHFITTDIQTEGVYYGNVKGFNEQNISAAMGYKYQDVKNSVSISPFFEKQWFDGDAYHDTTGFAIKATRHLSSSWQINGYLRYANKDYEIQQLARSYDAEVYSLGMGLSHAVRRNLVLFGGISYIQDDTKAEEKSSKSYGANIGLMAQKDDMVGGQLSLHYAWREFEAKDGFIYDFVRKDNEYAAQLALWSPKISYQNLMPKLNLQYHKIDSNMEQLYSRENTQIFVSMDKKF